MWQDLRLALGFAVSVSQPTPMATATKELYKVAKSRGLRDEDLSKTAKPIKGVKVVLLVVLS